jgi:hypothetical protein
MSLAALAMSMAIISLPASSGSLVVLPVVQVGGEGGEALGREPVAHVGDVGDEAPPLLDDDQTEPGALLRAAR